MYDTKTVQVDSVRFEFVLKHNKHSNDRVYIECHVFTTQNAELLNLDLRTCSYLTDHLDRVYEFESVELLNSDLNSRHYLLTIGDFNLSTLKTLYFHYFYFSEYLVKWNITY